MKKLRATILASIFLCNASFGGAIPKPPDGGYPVMDVTSIARLEDEIKEMGKQLEQQTQAADHLKNEIAQLSDFQNPDTVRTLLAESNKLIGQSKDIEYTLNKETDFAKSYQGAKPLGELLGGSGTTYDAFYKDNANMTLSTINSANKAIEGTNKAFNDDTVNSAVGKAQDHIMSAQGTTQAVSGLAEINVQLLQQLQAMN
ncbi:MAG: hypothetical protein K0R24_2247, partial [Gammaproteobacteria bacterium]|nr:hypothetical protein [Gammaproteobacteria bacterium]